MSTRPLPPGLHLVLGDSAGDVFNRAFEAQGRLRVYEDVLCVGPTAACNNLAAWKAMRDEFWDGIVPGGIASHVSSPLNLIDDLECLRAAGQVTCWAATSVSEQLYVAHVIELMTLADADLARLSLVQFEAIPGRPRAQILGTGELDERQMREHPRPRALTRDELSDYRAAWIAMTSPDPTLLERFPATHHNANPWLRRAMQLMRRRFPEKKSGLPYWDRVLLQLVREHGPNAARIVGHALTREWEDADLTGDWYLFGRLRRMSDPRLPSRLLDLTGDRDDMRSCEARLTPFGDDVLDGRASSFPTNPIEDWAAGVELSSSRGQLWFDDDGALVRH